MEAQVHILCSNCEKVLAELPKENQNKESVINIEEEKMDDQITDKEKKEIGDAATNEEEKDPSLNFKSMTPDAEDSSFCEIKIDYSKKERKRSSLRLAEDMILKEEILERRKPSFGDATMKKLEPTIDKIRRIAGMRPRKDDEDNISLKYPFGEKSRFWLFPKLPDKDDNEMTAADETALKKKNQRRDDIRVYITMATIVVIAAIVTITKIFVQKHLGLEIK